MIPVLLAALITVGAIAGFWSTRRALAGSMARDSAEIATAQAALVSANLAADAELLTTTASALGGIPQLGPQLAGIHAPDPLIDGLKGTDLLGRPSWRLGLDLARDEGTAVATAATAPDATPILLEAVPLYGPGPAPATVDNRRHAILGFVVLVGPAFAVLGPPTPRASVRLLEGPAILAANGDRTPPASAAGAPVTGVGSDWVIQAWSTTRRSRLPDVILIGGLAIAVIGATVVMVGEAESDRLARAAMSRSNELSLVARTGPLLQESLELGELLRIDGLEVARRVARAGRRIVLHTNYVNPDVVRAAGAAGVIVVEKGSLGALRRAVAG